MNRFILRGRALTRCVTSLVLCGMVIPFAIITAQAPEAKGKKKADKPPREPGTFFVTEDPLDVTFTTNIGRIRRDKGEKAPWRTATVSYTGADAKAVVVPIQIQTRGIWRLKNCEFPPIRINFARETSKGSVFYGLNQPKLTSYCRDDDLYEQYLLQELQLYRI
ncbi:MAG: hypothetical protein ACRD1B_03695, partial [Thermoanaerobaculia bacterium]